MVQQNISTSYSDLFVSQDVKAIYKRHLLLDIEYKKLKMRKVQLEIKKQEKEVSTILNTAQVHVFGKCLIHFFPQLLEDE